MILRFLRLWCALVFLALPVAAQETAGPDYDAWGSQVTTAEQVVTDATATDAQLNTLRAEMVQWRATFAEAQGGNGDQIETVKGQIAALGAPPAEGATEDPAIADRRKELAEALTKLQAPGITAGEAATRADGIVRNIDKILRERQADKLLRLSPSPLNPVNWAEGGSLLRWMGQWIYDETEWRFTHASTFGNLRDNAPLIIVLVVVSAILMLRGSRWMLGLANWLLGKTARSGRDLVTGFVALGQVVLPVAGAVMLTQALSLTTLFGPIMMRFFDELPLLVLATMGSWWLGARIFPASAEQSSALGFSGDGWAEGRVHALTMGLLLSAQYLVSRWIEPRAEDYLGGSGRIAADKAQEIAARAEEALAVLQLPLLLLAGIALFRMGQLMRRQLVILQSQDGQPAFRLNLLKWIAGAVILLSVVGPVLGGIGYVSAANAIVWPAIITLGLIATVAVLQTYVADLYAVITHTEDRRSETLVPILAGFVLTLLALPVAALIWGARPTELAELWTQFLNGFPVGGVRISPGVFLTFVVIFAIGYTATRLVQGALRETVLPKTSLDRGGQNAIVSGMGYIGIFLAALLAISTAGIDLSSFAIVAGALSVGVGFGLQTIVQNFVSGIILLVERPISEGDWIEVSGTQGIVKAISVRATRIETFDRSEVVVPNASLIAGSVTNLTKTNRNGRVIIKIGVAYGTDTRRVAEILKEIGESHPLVMMNPGPIVIFTDFGADSMNFELRVILSDVNFGSSVRTELNHRIAERFAKEGIEIPFAQRDLWLRNPDTLARALIGNVAPPAAGPLASDSKTADKDPADTEITAIGLSNNDGEEEGDRR